MLCLNVLLFLPFVLASSSHMETGNVGPSSCFLHRRWEPPPTRGTGLNRVAEEVLMGLDLDLDSSHSSVRTNRKANHSHQWGETNRSIRPINNETEQGGMLVLRWEGSAGDVGSPSEHDFTCFVPHLYIETVFDRLSCHLRHAAEDEELYRQALLPWWGRGR